MREPKTDIVFTGTEWEAIMDCVSAGLEFGELDDEGGFVTAAVEKLEAGIFNGEVRVSDA